MSERTGHRLAAGWFLGCIAIAFVLFAWLRGAGRLLIPLAVLGLGAYCVLRLLRKIREPLP